MISISSIGDSVVMCLYVDKELEDLKDTLKKCVFKCDIDKYVSNKDFVHTSRGMSTLL